MRKYFLIASLLFASSVYADNNFSSVYKDYQKAFENQDYSKAVPLAEQALALGEEKFGAESQNARNLKFSLANTYFFNRESKKAIPIYDDLLNFYIEKFGENSIEVLSVRTHLMKALGKVSLSDSYGRKYRSEARRTLELIKNLSESQPDTEAFLYYEFVDALMASNNMPMGYRKLIPIVENTEALLLESVGDKDNRTIRTQFLLAKMYKAHNKFETAINQFEKLVVTLDDALTFSHPYELGAHARLVELYEKTGESEKATEHCLAIGRMTPWKEDIEPTPLYRVNPVYPMKAARIGSEGWVRMSFNITPFGFVENIEVIESTGHRGFVSASKEALSEWRYAPKFVDGVATTVTNRTVQLDFKMAR